MIGLIQEQHADRCRLFQQWKGLDFPIVQDPVNQNGIAVVPVYIAIDEHGIVQSRRPNPRTFAKEFIEKSFDAPSSEAPRIAEEKKTISHWQMEVRKSESIESLLGLGDAYLLWKRTKGNASKAIEAYEKAWKLDESRYDIQFRLGSAYRFAYELDGQQSQELFEKSVSHWEKAYEMNRRQYIYWRRIQQYGPRMKKPYSFYDWVAQARKEIEARGEKPHPLSVEPNGAELAQRSRSMVVDKSAKNPDPKNEIPDEQKMIASHVNFVPTNPKPGDVVAVHVGFNVVNRAKWNHATEPVSMWIEPPNENIKLSSQLIFDP